MDIGNALRRTGREEITLRASIAKTIAEIYPKDVKIESVKIHGNIILIRTGKSLINSELQILEGDIRKASQAKLEKLGIKISKNIRFRFI